jgi:hypothetical protein
VHSRQLDAETDHRLSGRGRDPGQDHRRAEQADHLGGLQQVMGDRGVHLRHPCDVEEHDLRAILDDAAQDALGQLGGALPLQRPDQRHEEHAVVQADDRHDEIA